MPGSSAWIFDDRVRRLLLAEAMRAFAAYLRAKAALYNPDAEGRRRFRALIDAHAALVDRLQAARDALFARRSHPVQLKRIDTLIALLDAFETMLSSDADLELLRRSGRRDIKWRMQRAWSCMIAEEVDGLTLALRSRHGHVAPRAHEQECAALIAAVRDANENAPEDAAIDHAFTVTADKLHLADANVAALAMALDRDTPPSPWRRNWISTPFASPAAAMGWSCSCASSAGFSPALRYAIRLALAMTAGLALTLIFPRFAHANWVLLTIALIMRANYSVTSQRRWDRVTGTLIGCALAVALIYPFPPALLADRHRAGGGDQPCLWRGRYRITADRRLDLVAAAAAFFRAAGSSAILRAHRRYADRRRPVLGIQFSAAQLGEQRPAAHCARLAGGRCRFCRCGVARSCPRQTYRLARKKAMDAVAHLSGAIRRLADEPNSQPPGAGGAERIAGRQLPARIRPASMPVLMQCAEPNWSRGGNEIEATRIG